MKRRKIHMKGRKGHKMRKRFAKSAARTKAPNLFRGIQRGGKRF